MAKVRADLNPLLRSRVLRDGPAAAQDAAASHYTGQAGVAASGLVLDLP